MIATNDFIVDNDFTAWGDGNEWEIDTSSTEWHSSADDNANCTGTITHVTNSTFTVQCGDIDFPDFEELEEFVIIEHIFNPAIQHRIKSQTHRRAVKYLSGCCPNNRGRHFDRKLRA